MYVGVFVFIYTCICCLFTDCFCGIVMTEAIVTTLRCLLTNTNGRWSLTRRKKLASKCLSLFAITVHLTHSSTKSKSPRIFKVAKSLTNGLIGTGFASRYRLQHRASF